VSTPITFSGFNDIDFNLVVNSLMAQASLPLNTLQSRQKSLQSQVTGFDKLATHVEALRSAADALGRPANLSTMAGVSSNDAAVSVSAGATAVAGHYDIVVNELARAQVTVSSSFAPDANTTIVASAGTIDIAGITVSVAGDVTLQQLAATINAAPSIGVTATVVRTGMSEYKLALTSSMTGSEHAFTIVNNLTGTVQFVDTDNNGISGDTAADNAVTASDASILLNNIPATSSSNTFENVVDGVTLTVAKKDPASTVAIDVATDTAAIKEKLQAFVTAYNEFVKFAGEQRTSAGTGDAASIGREPILRQLHNSLRAALAGAHGTGVLTRLAEAGVEFKRNGELTLNEDAFDAAVTAGGDDLRALFSAADGAFPALESMLDVYAQVDGLIPSTKKRLQDQIASMNDQIEAMQRRLALQRESLQKQFAEADLIMSRLKSQASSLSGFSSGLGSL
jgi:flagellar hook-associated protein 2